MVKRPVAQTQRGTPHGVGVHVQNRHSGGGCDRKRGGDHRGSRTHIFYGGWLSSPPFSDYLITAIAM